MQLQTSALQISNEILPQTGLVLPQTLLLPFATGLGSLLQKGLRFLAPGPVMNDFSPRVHHFYTAAPAALETSKDNSA